ncbi:hypothetical protein SH501x_002870 [Pirellulaceae bacterium SH501]
MSETPERKTTVDDRVEAQRELEGTLARIADAIEHQTNEGYSTRTSFLGWSAILFVMVALTIFAIRTTSDLHSLVTNLLLLVIAILLLDRKYQLNRKTKRRVDAFSAMQAKVSAEVDEKTLGSLLGSTGKEST